jgi:hypothetical protein
LAGRATLATFRALAAAVGAASSSTILAEASEAVVFAIIQRTFVEVAVALAMTVGADVAFAGDDFPLSGNYTQNVLCKGDGTDPVAIRVKISPQEIVSNVGTCTVLDTTRDGDTFVVRVECKFASGPLMGNLSFTPKPDHTIDFVDRDGNYKAVLHPCPN